jgi:hypothetical protein
MAKDSERKRVKQTSSFQESLVKQGVEEPKYSHQEQQYRQWLLERLERARNVRESPHDEFDGRSYTDHYIANFKAANSYIKPRENPEDSNIVTGTTREKKNAVVSAVLNLNFETQMRAFDKDDMENAALGEAMTDLIEKSEKIEEWDEKKVLVYDELATQGDVFIEEVYLTRTKIDKKRIPLDKLTDETFKNFKAEKALKDVYSGCFRNIIAGTQVYLGDFKQWDINLQPYIFTKDIISYEEAKSIYGTWPRFANVPKDLVEAHTTDDSTHFGMNWRLGDLPKGMVEVIKYQDKWNDEYQIFLNGVMQLPPEFPMPWEYGEYNLIKGSLEPISAFCAYSKSIPAKSKVDQEVLDEMIKLLVLKTWKSFAPPIANYSNNVLSKTAFLPNKVNNDLTKGDIEVVGGDPGAYSVKPSEIQMFELIKNMIDEKSVTPVFQGQEPGGDPTATQVNIQAQQAKQNLGLMIFGYINLHNKLAMLRCYDILENYTKATDTKLNKTANAVEAKYRTVSIEKNIDDRGKGVKQIQFTDSLSTPEQLYDQEEGITRDETGMTIAVNPPPKPTKITQLSPTALRQIKMNWYAETVPSEKETSLVNRIAFEDSLQRAAALFGIQNLNLDYVKQQWALKNKINPDYFFTSQTAPVEVDPNQPGQSNVTKTARVSPPGVKQAAMNGA